MTLTYIPGHRYGPYDMLLLKRSDRQDPHSHKRKWGIYQSHYCGKEFEASNYSVKIGETKGCHFCRSERKKKYSKIGNLNKKYYPGMKLGPNNILFLKEFPKGNNIQRRGIFECPVCKQQNWISQISDIVSGKASQYRSCSSANQISKGEKVIEEILLQKNYIFKREYIFNDCINPKTGALLRFDFYLPDYNICIEYDGIQHFEESTWRHEKLEDVQYRDSLKNNYCMSNNIKLIRIPYWELPKINSQYLENKLEINVE